MLGVKITEVPTMVELCRRSKNNLLIVGDPGVGKSQTILGLESEHCKVTMLTGSSTYEETANGIPRDNKETGRQDYTRPSWFVEMLDWAQKHTGKDDYQVLFIDEFNTADPQVLKTFLSILSEKKIPTQPEKIPENVVMVAAMNPANQNEGEELIRPMASRFMTVEIKVSPQDFRAYIGGEAVEPKANIEIADKENDIATEQLQGFLDQVTDEDWQHFEEGSYHEINPRSFDNFFRALKRVKDPKKSAPILSQAFFGRSFMLMDAPEILKAKAEARAEKVKKGDVLPSETEIKAMDTAALQALKRQLITKSSAKNMACVAKIIAELTNRGEA